MQPSRKILFVAATRHFVYRQNKTAVYNFVVEFYVISTMYFNLFSFLFPFHVIDCYERKRAWILLCYVYLPHR